LFESFFKVALTDMGFNENESIRKSLASGFKYGGYNTTTFKESKGTDFLLALIDKVWTIFYVDFSI
jgi:hypothetical protein